MLEQSATSAVEFAIVFPVFVFLIFGTICYGSYFAIVHSLQQLCAESARAAVAGLSDQERLSLANRNIDANADAYPLLARSNLTVESAETDPVAKTFSVTLRFDASGLLPFSNQDLIPMPAAVISRTAVIHVGGY